MLLLNSAPQLQFSMGRPVFASCSGAILKISRGFDSGRDKALLGFACTAFAARSVHVQAVGA